MIPFRACRLKTLLLALLITVLSATSANAGRFRTPKDTMEVLLDAARRADAHLWSTCLSNQDRKIYSLSVGKKMEEDLLQQKDRAEKQYGVQLGTNAFEYAMFRSVHETTHGRKKPGDPETESLFHMAFIKQELIWDDRFAEVILVMPVEGKGIVPPMTFFFLKEDGEWKLFQWMTARLLLGWSATNMYDYNDLVSYKVTVHSGGDFDRRNCSHTKKREFSLPGNVSAAYRKAVDQRPQNEELLALWHYTGDSNAQDYMAATGRKLKAPHGYLLSPWIPCDDKIRPPRQQRPMPFATAEQWYMASDGDILGLLQVSKRFPQERNWRAKAHLEAARRIAYEGNPELGIKEYENLIWLYPDQKDVVVEAQKALDELASKGQRPVGRS